jgi:hypothetical protein
LDYRTTSGEIISLTPPLTLNELSIGLERRLATWPEADRRWVLAVIEQNVKAANRIDLIQAIAIYRKRLARTS